jgi:MFS family permease
VGSFAGRLLSGIGSDIVVKHNMSRLWCLVISSSLFCCCQFYASVLADPNYLFLLSALTGVAYGFLFGCFPSIVADTFGNNGLAQNWGTMTIAPILFGNVFNMIYGSIYDAHSDVRGSGHRDCKEGLNCYRSAYLVTLIASIGAIAGCLWSIRYGAITAARKHKAALALNEGHIA